MMAYPPKDEKKGYFYAQGRIVKFKKLLVPGVTNVLLAGTEIEALSVADQLNSVLRVKVPKENNNESNRPSWLNDLELRVCQLEMNMHKNKE